MVVQLGERSPEVAVTGGVKLEAEVDIAESNGELFLIEASDLQKEALANNEAGRGDRSNFTHHL